MVKKVRLRTAAAALTARRKAIASAKVIEGRTLTAVAAELGVTRETASKDFNAPETKDYIRELLGKHDTEIDALVTKSVAALDAGLGANVVWQGMECADRDGVKLADHKTRLRAVAETWRLAALRGGKNDDGNGSSIARNFSGTMEELLVLYRRVTTCEDAAAPE
jgi:hypothetical protein